MSETWPHPIKAVIFDNDGVLLDTIPMYAEANSLIIGQPYPDDFQIKVNGLGEYEFAKAVINEFSCQLTPTEFVDKRKEILRKLFPTVQLIPGVDRVVDLINAKDIPMAVATSCNREAHSLKIQHHLDIFAKFRVTVCGDDVSRAKPSPEIFQTASMQLGTFLPENILVFEDSYVGIKAANAAGMASVFLGTGSEDINKECEKAGVKPSLIIKSFDSFNLDLFKWDCVT